VPVKHIRSSNNSTEYASDLFCYRVDVSDARFQKGEKIDVGAIVINQGAVPAENFSVSLLVDDKEKDSRIIQSLAPGEKISVNFTWRSNSEGEQMIEVFVDSKGDVFETDENNNIDGLLIEVFSVSSPPYILIIILSVGYITGIFYILYAIFSVKKVMMKLTCLWMNLMRKTRNYKLYNDIITIIHTISQSRTIRCRSKEREISWTKK